MSNCQTNIEFLKNQFLRNTRTRIRTENTSLENSSKKSSNSSQISGKEKTKSESESESDADSKLSANDDGIILCESTEEVDSSSEQENPPNDNSIGIEFDQSIQ